MRPNRPFIVQRSTVYSFADAAENLQKIVRCRCGSIGRSALALSSALQTIQNRPPSPQAGAFRDAATAAPFKNDIRLSGADQLDEERSRSFCARLISDRASSGLGVAFANCSLSMMSCLPVVWSRPHVAAFFAMPPCCCMACGMAGDSRMDTSCSIGPEACRGQQRPRRVLGAMLACREFNNTPRPWQDCVNVGNFSTIDGIM